MYSKISQFLNGNSFSSKKTQEDYLKKLYNRFSSIAIVAVVVHITIIALSNNSNHGIPFITLSATSLLVCAILLFLRKFNLYNESKILALFIFPLLISASALIQNDKSVSILLLLMGIVSFIYFDKIKSIALSYGFNMFLYLGVQIKFLGLNQNLFLHQQFYLLIFNVSLVFGLSFFLLTHLKNTVNFYVKRMTNDNNALVEMNSDLMQMHDMLKSKNKQLESDKLHSISSYKHISKLFSVISHDIKSPLVSVKNILNYTKDLNANKDEIIKYIPEISKTMNNTVQLLENLILWSREQYNGEERKEEVVHFKAVVDEVIELYELHMQSKNIKINIHAPSNVFVTFNKQMLLTVLRNVVSNAVKFTPQNGIITIATAPIKNQVRVQVTNTVNKIEDRTIQLLNNDVEMTTEGTIGENGSGLGLLLAKDFLRTNQSNLVFYKLNDQSIACEFMLKAYSNNKLKAINSRDFEGYNVATA
jgi:signal transduction histidine kinase